MQPDPYNELRRSQQRRLTAINFAKSKIAEQSRSEFDGIKVYEISDWEGDAPDHDDFLEILSDEYRGKADSWISVLKDFMVDGFAFNSTVCFTPHLTVNAGIRQEAGFLNWLFKHKPSISVNLGLVLAIEDLVGYCLSTKSFFTCRTSDGELSLENPSFKIGAEHPLRFLNYAPILASTKGLAQAATVAIPFSPWRLSQIDLICDVCVFWTVLHEQSHYMAGHLNELRERSQAIALDENERTQPVNASSFDDRLRVFEMEADSQAAFVTYDFFLADATNASFKRYRECIRGLDLTSARRTSVVGVDDELDMLRLLIVAIGLVVVLLENKRASSSNQFDQSTYPSPVTRLFGVFFSIGMKYLGVIENAETPTVSSDKLRVLFKAYMNALLDLQLAISLLDIKTDVFRPFIWENVEGRDDGFSDDLFKIMTSGSVKPQGVRTDAAREFLYLRSMSEPAAGSAFIVTSPMEG